MESHFYPERYDCTFKNLGVNCSKDLPCGFMCANHARMLFHIVITPSTLYKYNGGREKRIYTKLSAYNEDIGLLPFPFLVTADSFENEIIGGLRVAKTSTFCVDTNVINQQINQFVSQTHLKPAQEKLFIEILMSILATGQGYFANVCDYTANFIRFCRTLDRIKYRMSKTYVAMQLTDQPNGQVLIPLSHFPPFYQGILYNMEANSLRISNNNYPVDGVFVVFAMNERKFKVDTENLYLCKDDATDASILVLQGFRYSQNFDPHNIPNQESNRYIGFNDIIKICNEPAEI